MDEDIRVACVRLQFHLEVLGGIRNLVVVAVDSPPRYCVEDFSSIRVEVNCAAGGFTAQVNVALALRRNQNSVVAVRAEAEAVLVELTYVAIFPRRR